ncbi:hypothetical protein JAAARDRAFT_124129 [Jaapia argillacea MUCL 33604]|uniref:UDP-galactose transporter n=1 Tax=Jaapia argillacea MUCL 33604 TaxID=933084 RepID=A0A067QCF6_9AGAM|nr:hypothetical protein JAAARDRAFT_124129 [Jaapia argillacea MUCL 33604]
MYHRPMPTVRNGGYLSASEAAAPSSGNGSGHRPAPLVSVSSPGQTNGYSKESPSVAVGSSDGIIGVQEVEPMLFGLPLKYVSLVTLAVQNAALSIVMHYSRVSTPPSRSYSPAAAVLLNEILKGSISFVIALLRVYSVPEVYNSRNPFAGVWRLYREIFSADCWKLSIPAVLYVVQNSLQFVAISNLPVASFQVSYQMKILTTAAFSVVLLGRKLTSTKWVALCFLALGVGIVQIQTTASTTPRNVQVGSAHDSAPIYNHIMSPLKGFGAVTAACFTSGLAGVYFEMVLKNSKADLWVRNVQLSLFSLIPALLPILYAPIPLDSRGFFLDIFRHFGWWAWATVGIQVFGGLVTAIVIKYSDNILKGFATSLSIILSFLASVVLFHFRITPSFVLGSSTVLAATWMYNQPAGKEPTIITNVISSASGRSTPFPGSPVERDAPILGDFSPKKGSPFGSPRALASALGLASEKSAHVGDTNYFPQMSPTTRYLNAPYGSPFPSRTPSPAPPSATNSRPPSRVPSYASLKNDSVGQGQGQWQ